METRRTGYEETATGTTGTGTRAAPHTVETPTREVHEHRTKMGATADEAWQKTKAAVPGTKEHAATRGTTGATGTHRGTEYGTTTGAGYGTTGTAAEYGTTTGAGYGTTAGLTGTPVAESETIGMRPGGIKEGREGYVEGREGYREGYTGTTTAGTAEYGTAGTGYGTAEGYGREGLTGTGAAVSGPEVTGTGAGGEYMFEQAGAPEGANWATLEQQGRQGGYGTRTTTGTTGTTGTLEEEERRRAI